MRRGSRQPGASLQSGASVQRGAAFCLASSLPIKRTNTTRSARRQEQRRGGEQGKRVLGGSPDCTR